MEIFINELEKSKEYFFSYSELIEISSFKIHDSYKAF